MLALIAFTKLATIYSISKITFQRVQSSTLCSTQGMEGWYLQACRHMQLIVRESERGERQRYDGTQSEMWHTIRHVFN